MGVKWVDANKGDKEKPEYRCRPVAKEIKKDEREDVFAATPPLKAKKALLSLFASLPGLRLGFVDVARSCLHAKARRMAHVDLPEEDQQDGTNGRLKKAMHGTRDAVQNWDLEYSETIIDAGYAQGSYSARFTTRRRMLALSHVEMILQYSDQRESWIGFAKSHSIAWR